MRGYPGHCDVCDIFVESRVELRLHRRIHKLSIPAATAAQYLLRLPSQDPRSPNDNLVYSPTETPIDLTSSFASPPYDSGLKDNSEENIEEESDSEEGVIVTVISMSEYTPEENNQEQPANADPRTSFCELCWLDRGPRHTETKPHTLGPTFPCGSCPLFFCSKGARTRHHSSTSCVSVPSTSLNCPVCNRRFNKKGVKDLRIHRKTHDLGGETPNLGTTSSSRTTPSANTMSASNTAPSIEAVLSVRLAPTINATAPTDTVPTAAKIVPAVDADPLSIFCKLCWKGFRNIEKHNKSKTHLQGHEVRCSRCVSERWFSSKGARKRHMASNSCSEFEEYRCCDCDISFATAKLLKIHTRDITIHPPRAVPGYVDHNGDVEELATYLGSVTLNAPSEGPIKCLGMGCGRSFTKTYAMLTHIESGFCRSKLNRDIIDDIIIANDHTNIITDAAAVEARAQDRASIASSECSSSINGSVFLTPSEADSDFQQFGSDILVGSVSGSDGTITPRARRVSDHGSDSNSDSDDDDYNGLPTPSDSENGVALTPSDSGDSDYYYLPTPSDSEEDVYLTPSNSGDSGSGVYFTPSETSGGSLFTLSTDTLGSLPQPTVIKCPICPTSVKRVFPNIEALHTHLRSKVHQAKIYHCPSPDAPGSGATDGTRACEVAQAGKKKNKRKKEAQPLLRVFATLSALGQHVDSGSCKKGERTFNATVAFLHEKLKEMGRADV